MADKEHRPELKKFCKMIWEARKSMDLSLREAAHLLSISHTRLCQYEGRMAVPREKVLKEMSVVYGISEKKLFATVDGLWQKSKPSRDVPGWKWARMYFSKVVRVWEKKAKLTFDQVAAGCGISPIYYLQIKRGKKPIPSYGLLRRLGKTLGQKPHIFYKLKMLDEAHPTIRRKVAEALDFHPKEKKA